MCREGLVRLGGLPACQDESGAGGGRRQPYNSALPRAARRPLRSPFEARGVSTHTAAIGERRALRGTTPAL